MCFATKVDRDALGYATHSLPPTRSECDVGEPVTEPTISATVRAVANTAGNWSLGDRGSADARSDSATTRDAGYVLFSCASDGVGIVTAVESDNV